MNQTMSNHGFSIAARDTLRLSPVSCLVLGLIGLRGPSTPYDLKKAVGRSVSYFWPFPHSQLYGEPERLAEAGLLTCKTEQIGRRRKLYRLTRKGAAALKQWLRTSPGELFEMRDMAVLQLFFSEFMSEADLVALANNQVRLARERLLTYAQIERKYMPRMGRNRRMASLSLGVRMANVYLEFWDEIARRPPPAEAVVENAKKPRGSLRRAR
ncbi:PadR family transcriptional regulator [Bradyrhizobium neotropicale]|uniref:PadR family transcriptional regulator n=1 Tax=Bradyrhizobium neotropicale TaxID=1497615 RepID=UPI001AD7E2DE|nr:PadR family transcriptional regulator [Bradyrhizobium neotropicale]MBO4225748.1 PadR family transcriptional regulator [Bradyrhizobium neotropicale]